MPSKRKVVKKKGDGKVDCPYCKGTGHDYTDNNKSCVACGSSGRVTKTKAAELKKQLEY